MPSGRPTKASAGSAPGFERPHTAVQSGEAPLEIEDARASAFLAICEVGKALHRGQPADSLYAVAIKATERWVALVR